MATQPKETKEQEGQRADQGVQVPRSSESVVSAGPHRRGAMAPFGGWPPFDRLFEQFFRGWPALWAACGRDWHWGLDVREDDTAVTVQADAPGFEPGDFDLQVRGDQLVLRAAHEEEEGEKGGPREWRRQEFYRSVSLPPGIDPDKVEAKYRNGVLTVTLPKTEASKGRRITVQG